MTPNFNVNDCITVQKKVNDMNMLFIVYAIHFE